MIGYKSRWLLASLLAVNALLVMFTSRSASAEDLEDCQKANAAYEAGNYDDAIDHFTACIDRADLAVGDLAVAYYNRALAYEMNGDYDQAIRDHSEAIRIGFDRSQHPGL